MNYNYNKQYQKNIEILTRTEKILKEIGEKNGGGDRPAIFEIKGKDGESRKVSKEEFARWMMEGKEEKNIETPPQESLVFGASGDIDSITYYTEVRSKDGFIRESYYQPRSEEEKEQIRKRQEINKKRREEEKVNKENEKLKIENSPNSDNKNQKVDKETNKQQNFSHKSDDNKKAAEKENNKLADSQTDLSKDKKSLYYGIGVISAIVLLVSLAVVWIKGKK